MNKRIALGLDFGTESGRVILVDVENGRELATVVKNYPHGVIDSVLPNGKTRLGPEWALQDPMDYLTVAQDIIPEALKQADARAEEIVGIGVDFTSCTILPTLADGKPLCVLDEFRDEPHAWVKLWKHHAAQPEADEINRLAEKRGERFLERYGGKISSEWLFPKALQILHEASEVYDAAERIIEAGDWFVWQLTGTEKRSACQAGYKAFWSKEDGYPSKEFLRELDPRFESFVEEKLSNDIYPVGFLAGGLTKSMAGALSLKEGTPVGVGIIDAHAALLGSAVAEPEKMVLVLGTSTCHMVLGEKNILAKGIAGIVEDGIVPGYTAYESGQSAVGDIFAWFMRTSVPSEYNKEAEEKGVDIYKLLEMKAARLKPGESGLMALDWWNGNRSILMNANLSGLMVGMTLGTKPEEIYRALIEATAFGTEKIIQTHEDQGIPIKELYACGGLAEKNELLLQIYADVTGREIRVAESQQAAALGGAIIGALAAGAQNGGYSDFKDATKKMARLKDTVYRPIPENRSVYRRLYEIYLTLHDYFGLGKNAIMPDLRELKLRALGIRE